MTVLENLLHLLDGPRDGALLRHAIGLEHMKAGDKAAAALRFREAVIRDPEFSAGWKMLGKALAETDQPQAALDAYTRGIAVAEARGDIQAAREMKVFARRLANSD